MRFTPTSAALSVLAAAIGSALFLHILGADAQSKQVAMAPAPMQVEQALAPAESGSQALSTGGMALPDFRQIVRENTDAIVKIEVSSKARNMTMGEDESDGQSGPGSGQSDPFQDFFRRFGGPGGPGGQGGQMPPQQGMGSGFIFGSDGRILTNAHVVKGADEVIVRLNDQRELKAKVLGLDERTDVAVLKIEATGLPTVKLGTSDSVEVGEWVLAIGAPFGLDYSATQGIVSATGRELPNENFVPFIQTDAAVNPGNSGGPLFNTRGDVIGINSQIYSRSGGYMGLSFAIPIKTAMGVAKQLEARGYVERGWLGVAIQSMNPQLAKQFGMEKPTGALVGGVSPASPAESAGLRPGDVILKFNGVAVKNSGDLPPMVAATPIGEMAKIDILRDGKASQLSVKVGKLKEEARVAAQPAVQEKRSVLDLTVADLDANQRDKLGVKNGGVIITDVRPGKAAEAGVQEGDVVLQVNRKPINSAAQFGEVLKQQSKEESTLLLIQRGGSSIFVVVEPA
jgi:serine protease Do